MAEELGDEEPSAFALADRTTAPDGAAVLVLKQSVVAALDLGKVAGCPAKV